MTRPRAWPFYYLAIACLGFLAAAPSTPETLQTLPPAIHATLDMEYPGWKLAPVAPQILQAFKKHNLQRSPSLVAGDFNQDGKRDYAMQIILTTPGAEEQIIMVFLAHGTGFEETIVQSMGLEPTVYLWVMNKNTLVVLGGQIGDTAYGYQDGRFQEVKSPEDPNTPDPTIPRAPDPNTP